MFLLVLALLAPPYGVIIENGRVVDGTGSGWFRADVAIEGDRIAAIGNLRGVAAGRRVDASGCVVAPGFIDTHSHGIDLRTRPRAENLIRQGVTTIIEGPDGSSPLPLRPFLEQMSRLPIAVNFGTLAGHGSIRRQVMGTVNRRATPDEIAQMRTLLQEAMLDGAFGLSTGLFYVPGNYAAVEEVIELAKVAGQYGGIHTSHMRDEASAVLESVGETIRIGEEGHLPTQVTHHKIIGKPNWGKSAATLRMVEQARARGVDVTLDQYPYTASSTGTAALFPKWSLAGGAQALAERLSAPDQLSRIKAEIIRRILEDRGGGDPANIVMASCRFDPALDGKSLAQITAARQRAVTPENAAETAIEIQSKGGCSAIFHAISEDDLIRILRYPHTMIASDGGIPEFGAGVPHPRNYGTFARILARYVREKEVLSLEEAVRRMSSLPAQRFKLFDRGLLRPGMKADIAVFDPATVTDNSTFEKPHQYATGVKYVWVNGKMALDAGRIAAAGGRVLYGPARATD